jgi:hypothetical protein
MKLLSAFDHFRSTSWDGWRRIHSRITDQTREIWLVVGRGAGKSVNTAALAVEWAFREWGDHLETYFVGVFAPDRKQAHLTFDYVRRLIRSVPELEAMVESETKETITLKNNVRIEVITASKAAPRGRSYVFAAIEEAAFLRSDASSDPDIELIRAIRPALARVPGSLLVVASSPHAQRGVIYEAWRRYREEAPEHVLFIQASTQELNPAFDSREIERAYQEDPVSAASEYGGAFRQDISAFIDAETLDECIYDYKEMPPEPSTRYVGFADPSGGQHDSFCAAIAHLEDRDTIVIDTVHEIHAPFRADAAVATLADFFHRYNVTTITTDKYARDWVVSMFASVRIHVEQIAPTKSQLFLDALPLFKSQKIMLPDIARIRQQFLTLERRTNKTGEYVEKAPGSFDDLANAVVGAVSLLAKRAITKGHAPHWTYRSFTSIPLYCKGGEGACRWSETRPDNSDSYRYSDQLWRELQEQARERLGGHGSGAAVEGFVEKIHAWRMKKYSGIELPDYDPEWKPPPGVF